MGRCFNRVTRSHSQTRLRSMQILAPLLIGFLTAISTGCSDASPPLNLKPSRLTASALKLSELRRHSGPVSLRLYCGNAGLTAGQIAIIRDKLPQLQKLSLSAANVQEQTANALTGLDSLQSFALQDGKVSSEGLKTILNGLQLQELWLNNQTGFSDSAISAIATETDLVELHFTNVAELSGINLNELSSLTKLTSLSISGGLQTKGLFQYLTAPPISIRGNWLAQLPRLESLSLRNCELDRESQRALAKLPNLKKLWLSDTNIDDNTMSLIGQLEHLQVLKIRNTNVTDIGIAELSASDSLEHLDLSATLVTDVGLDDLRELRLQHLTRGNTYITTDATLRFIEAMRNNGADVRIGGGSCSHCLDANTGKIIRALPVSPYRGSMLSGKYLYGMSLADFTKPARIRVLDFLEFENPIRDAQLSSDAKHVALPVGRNRIQIYRTDTGEKVFAIDDSLMAEGDNFMKDKIAVYHGRGAQVDIWDLATKTKRSIQAEHSSPTSIQLSPDGTQVLIQQFPYSYRNAERTKKSAKPNFSLLDTSTGRRLQSFLASRARFTTNGTGLVRVTEMPSQSRFVVELADGSTTKIDASWADAKSRYYEISPDGSRLLVCSKGKGILYSAKNGKPIREIADPFKQNGRMRFMPDGNIIVGQAGEFSPLAP